MPSSVATPKNPGKVAAGQAGARSRWGPPRRVRLNDLSADQRRLVLALIDAVKRETPAATTASAQEVSRVSDSTPTS